MTHTDVARYLAERGITFYAFGPLVQCRPINWGPQP